MFPRLLFAFLLALHSLGASAGDCVSITYNNGINYLTLPSSPGAICQYILTESEYTVFQNSISKNTTQDSQIAALQSLVSSLQTQQASTLTTVTSLQLSNADPIDYALCGSLFAFFFSSTVMLWAVSKGAGAILAAVKKF